MKTKRLVKKLRLNKHTVSLLDNKDMNGVQGGTLGPTEWMCDETWETCDPKRCGWTAAATCTCVVTC